MSLECVGRSSKLVTVFNLIGAYQIFLKRCHFFSNSSVNTNECYTGGTHGCKWSLGNTEKKMLGIFFCDTIYLLLDCFRVKIPISNGV